MKKKIIIWAASFLLVANILFANPRATAVPEAVAAAFHCNFSQVTEVQWQSWGNYYEAVFRQNGHTLYVFFSENAELMGTAKNVLSDKLAFALQTDLKNKYSDFWISDLTKYTFIDKTGFLVTVENADEKIVLKATDTHHWQVYSREAKA